MKRLFWLLGLWLALRLSFFATTGRGTATDSSILQFVLGKAAYSAPAGCYFALFTTTPTADNGTFTEYSGNNYSRFTIDAANSAAAWSGTTTDATGVWKTNANNITGPQASGTWTSTPTWGIYDASTVGTLLYWGTFTSAPTVGINTTPVVLAGNLKITEA